MTVERSLAKNKSKSLCSIFHKGVDRIDVTLPRLLKTNHRTINKAEIGQVCIFNEKLIQCKTFWNECITLGDTSHNGITKIL